MVSAGNDSLEDDRPECESRESSLAVGVNES